MCKYGAYRLSYMKQIQNYDVTITQLAYFLTWKSIY